MTTPKKKKKVRKTPQRTVCVPPKTWDAAKATAKARGDVLSEVIRQCLERYVKRHAPREIKP